MEVRKVETGKYSHDVCNCSDEESPPAWRAAYQKDSPTAQCAQNGISAPSGLLINMRMLPEFPPEDRVYPWLPIC